MKQSFATALILGMSLLLAAIAPASKAADTDWPEITSRARPWAWWWWHGSAVDRTNITRELERFRDAGLGGVQVTTIYGVKGAEPREIPYLTPAWLNMMGFTVDEAHKLGMGVDMTLGSGWCFGGPTVSDSDANANVVVKTYDVAAGGTVGEKFSRKTIQALVAFSPDGKSIELTDKISGDGKLDWTAPAGTWTVYAVSQKPSGQRVKRPSIGGEGWMLNPAYPTAMTDWLKWFDKGFADYHGSKPHAVFQDSYEYRTDWSPDFFAQFEKRRGYKLQNELPALFFGVSRITDHGSLDPDHIARVKYDYRLTLSDIMVEQSEPAWIDWAHKNGFVATYQAHGTPANWLDLYADADIPETEMFHNDRNILISKFASSAAHVTGRQLVGAETGTWLKEHFTETLADVKYLADDMFLSGVNHIFYHGTCYSPDDAPWPGWLFYASTEMNPRNPIWHDVRALNDYIARVQSVLQSGKPDNDILLYWPVADFWSDPNGLVQAMAVGKTDWFEKQPIGKTAHELWDKGYQFDYVSDRQLLRAKVVDEKVKRHGKDVHISRVQMPGGKYRIIVVPKCNVIPFQTFEQLLTFANEGACIVFDKLPLELAGLNISEQERNKFTNQIAEIESELHPPAYGNCPYTKFGKGEIWAGGVTWAWPVAFPMNDLTDNDNNLYFVRRSFDGGRNYFIVNRGLTNFDTWISLDWPAESVIILDPFTGTSGVASHNTENQIHLQLGAGESIILRVFSGQKVEGQPWAYWQTNGEPKEINGTWNVKFVEGGPVWPADTQTTKLGSWTTFSDTNCQAFAGTAKYTLEFNLQVAPDTLKRELQHALLDLGDVRQSARVTLNGKNYGTLITPPFRVIVDNLKPSGNQLEVEVTSVAANRIRDLDRRGVKWKIFKDINIVDINYKPFDASNWPLTDCGLLGPVTLTPVVEQ